MRGHRPRRLYRGRHPPAATHKGKLCHRALRAGWGIYGLIIPPFLIQSLYNNWYWPLYYQRLLHMSEATLLAKGGKMLIGKVWKRQ